MNIEQAKSNIRWFIGAFGAFIAGWFSAKGWFTIDQVTSVLNNETTISVLASLAMLVWGWITHTEKNAIVVVDAIAQKPASPVKAVVMEPTIEGRDIAASIPGNTTVVAGTTAAANLAKAA